MYRNALLLGSGQPAASAKCCLLCGGASASEIPAELTNFKDDPHDVFECALCLLASHKRCLQYVLDELTVIPTEGLTLPKLFCASGVAGAPAALCVACSRLDFSFPGVILG